MAGEYYKVLSHLNENVIVFCTQLKSAKSFKKKFDAEVYFGDFGILSSNMKLPDQAIVATSIENLTIITKNLLNLGIKKILVEKPGALELKELKEIDNLSNKKKAKVFIGYNRRFYISTKHALKMIDEDGGIQSCFFEFTEWPQFIPSNLSPIVKQKWLISNSSHVIDLVFFLSGKPKKISAFYSGQLNWHQSASNFCGSGITDKNILFTYLADWNGPGRWGIELITCKRRLIFRPMEKLHIQEIGSTNIKLLDINYSVDEKFKPGIFNQTNSFLNNDFDKFCTINDQVNNFKFYNRIAGYDV